MVLILPLTLAERWKNLVLRLTSSNHFTLDFYFQWVSLSWRRLRKDDLASARRAAVSSKGFESIRNWREKLESSISRMFWFRFPKVSLFHCRRLFLRDFNFWKRMNWGLPITGMFHAEERRWLKVGWDSHIFSNLNLLFRLIAWQWDKMLGLWSEACLERWERMGSLKTWNQAWLSNILSSLAITYFLPWPLLDHVKGLPLYPISCNPVNDRKWWKSLEDMAWNLDLLHLSSEERMALKSLITPQG